MIDAFEGRPLSLSKHAERQIRWVANKLTASQILKLKQLPLNTSAADYFFCHAIADNNRTIFTPHNDLIKIKSFFQEIKEPFIICGHTHLQFKLDIGSKIIFNAGSIGMPFSDQEGAQWLWIEDQTFHFKKTIVNKNSAIKSMKTTDFLFLNEFIETYVKNTVSISNAYEMLDKLAVEQQIRFRRQNS
ncbi:metallophosphoesterase [Liquorilactobacillus oeni DSM 19972]|uniref:Metallophosphoesterase n=1 Tax=Liquorilactobacillus oeni DSM 19972 TaxID=1423777 RepID=A0A0R1MIK6_9LACO|nr:metallophosphoesterase [Liquorilactobacillus oeni DSM 19972]